MGIYFRDTRNSTFTLLTLVLPRAVCALNQWDSYKIDLVSREDELNLKT